MGKHRVVVLGSVGKSILVDDSLGPRLTAAEAAILALQRAGGGSTLRHSTLQGLQIGNDHPQYPLSRGRETIRGQWDFTKQVWATLGTEGAPGYAFTDSVGTGMWDDLIAGDPHFANVVVLLHCDGTNGGTVFTDSSIYARTITRSGAPTTSTAQKKFGTASLDARAGAGYLTYALAAEVNFTASTQWTVDGWIYRPAGVNIASIYNQAAGTSITPMLIDVPGGSNQIRMSGLQDPSWSSAYSILSPIIIPPDQWVHYACVRDGSNFYLFQDGVLQGTASYSGPLAQLTGPSRFAGEFGSEGYHDEFRITIGTARWTANFTPPAAPDIGGDQISLAFSVDADEKFRMGSDGQLGIGGANYGTARQSFLSGGASAPPTWSTLVHTDISDWDEAVQDTVGAMCVDSTSIDFTYNDGAGTLTAATINANPSGLIGMTAVNGTAATPLRSDGRHAIDPAIAPTWTGVHTFTNAGSGAVVQHDTGSLLFKNTAGTVVGQIGTVKSILGSGSVTDFAFLGNGTNFSFIAASGRTLLNLAAAAISVGNATDLTPLRLANDNQELQLGAGQDLRLYHDGTDSWVRNDTGELRFSLAGALSLRLTTAALSFRSTTARGSGNCYINMSDPTGDKGYFGYGFADDTFTLVNLLNADMTFWTNSAERMRFPAAGGMTLSNQTSAATATAGAATLPANPVGFLVVSINGTSRKIPYYAT